MSNEFLDFFSALRASHAQNETSLEHGVGVAKVPVEASVIPATSGEVEDVESPSSSLPSNHASPKDKSPGFNIDYNIPDDDHGRDENAKDSIVVERGERKDKDRHSSLPENSYTDVEPLNDDNARVPWDSIDAAAHQIGPNLRALREEQERQPHGSREEYSFEHARRLELFPPKRPYPRKSRSKHCSEVHPQVNGTCPFGCKSCHFCRQRTIEPKTICSRCEGVNNFYGGKGRGYWCGSCLWARIGENADEVRQRNDWICPACRDLCNCSGANCMRVKRGWFPSGQLHSEAKAMGFRSVAHYLVWTQLSKNVKAALISEDLHHPSSSKRKKQSMSEDDLSVFQSNKKGRTLYSKQPKLTRNSLGILAAGRIEAEIETVTAELKFSFLGDINSQQTNMQTTKSVLDSILGSGVLGTSKRFLGILESDMQDECELNLDGKVMGERNAPDSTSYTPKERSPFDRPFRTDKVKTELFDAAFADWCSIRKNPHKNKNDTLLPGNAKIGSKKIEFCEFISSDNGKLELLKNCAGGLNNEEEGPHLGFNETMAENKQLRRPFAGTASNNLDWKNKVPYEISKIKSGPYTANPHRTWSVANTDIEGFSLSNVFPVYPPSDEAINCAHKKPPEEPSKSPKSSGTNVMEATTGQLDYSLKADGPKFNQNPMQAIRKQNSETTTPEVLGLEEGNNGNLDVNIRCTDAYTDLNNKFSLLKTDEFIWTCLINRAVSIVQVFRMLSVHYPESSQYIGPLFGSEIDKENYELFSDTSKCQLRNILREAESLLPHSVTFPNKESSKSKSSQTLIPTTPSTAYCIGHLRTYQGLRTAINFLLYLSRLLPYEDIYWRIQRRLTGIEPMIDFGGSDARSRAIVMRGILELIATLHRRGMEISEASKQLCVYLSYIVKDLSRVASVLNIILKDKTLPEENFSIGSWELNQEQRSLPLIDIFSDLSAMYAAHTEIFCVVVRSISAFAEVIGNKASIFFVEPLMSEIFQVNAGLPANLKREALGMLCTLISAVSDNFVNDCNLSMSAEEIEARKTNVNRVSLVLGNQVVPYLELMVQKEYQMRGLPDNLPPVDGHGSELKSEYIEALAQCYGFLLESGYLSWSQVEEKIAYPYSFRAFWRQANTAYRRLGIFMIAHILANAPNALKNDAAAVASARTWLMAISDIGGRQCLTYLTETLRRNHWTAPLFSGTQAIPLIATDASSDTIRSSLIFVVLSRLATRSDWKNKFIDLISDLDIILASRKKELQCTAFDPVQAVSSWETTETKIFLSVGAALLNVIQLKDDKVNLHQLPWLKDIIAIFHRFLLKATSNMLGACNTLQRSMHFGSCKQTALDSKFTSHGSDEGNLSLCSLGEIRSKLRKSSFGSVGYLINLLYQLGAPNIFDHCMEFWEIFTSISMGVIEIGTGNATPSLVDTAIFEAIAAAMASAEDIIAIYPLDYLPLEYHAYRPKRIDRDARLELCLYFLNGFARRTLSRANLPHVSNERRAINVIRICDQMLRQPLFLENGPRFDAFKSLMWPTIEVLLPEENRRVSIASKDAVYSLLKRFVSDDATFLPNLTPRPTEYDGIREIIHHYWVAICQDALDCVKNILPADLVTKNISAVKSTATPFLNAPTDSFIWPWGECQKAEARNNLLKASHIDDRFSSIDILLTKTSAPGIPQVLGHTPSYNFRPGDLSWDLASTALSFLQVLSGRPNNDSHNINFGSIEPLDLDPNKSIISNHANVTEQRNSNIYWVLASFPALHAMIPCSGSHSKRLHEHYKKIRELLEKEFGEDELSVYPLQAPNERTAPHFGSSHGEQTYRGCRPEEEDKIKKSSEECHLDDVLKAEPGQRLNVVAVLTSVHDKTVKFRMPTAVGHLENVKNNGEKVGIKLMAGQKISPKLAIKLIEMNSKNKLPCIIHLVDATVSEPSGHRILVGTRRTQITFSDKCSIGEM